VVGRIGDWTIPLGPYTPMQITVLVGGAFVLIRTFTWWSSALGPIPVVVWALAVWATRSPRVGGMVPTLALWGVVRLAARHPAGRIGRRVARDRRGRVLHGRVWLSTELPDTPPQPPVAEPAAKGDARAARSTPSTGGPQMVGAVGRLLDGGLA
jgi:hypothetical protein